MSDPHMHLLRPTNVVVETDANFSNAHITERE